MLKLEENNRLPDLDAFCITGELALPGKLRPVEGILSIALDPTQRARSCFVSASCLTVWSSRCTETVSGVRRIRENRPSSLNAFSTVRSEIVTFLPNNASKRILRSARKMLRGMSSRASQAARRKGVRDSGLSSLREPVPDETSEDYLKQWARVPLFLWLKARILK
jgi:hypothetical protein